MQKSSSFGNLVLSLALGLAVIPVFIYLVVSGANLFIPHDDFNQLRQECYEEHDPYYRMPYPPKGIEQPEQPGRPPQPEPAVGPQDYEKLEKCIRAVDELENKFELKQFVFGVTAGLIGLTLGIFFALRFVWFVGAGFVLGGIGSIIFGISMGAQSIGEAAVFAGTLIVLIVIGILSWVYSNKTRERT